MPKKLLFFSSPFANLKSVLLDGSNEYGDSSTTSIGTSALTVSAWIKMSALTSGLAIVTKWSASTNERSFVLQTQDVDNTKFQVLLGNGTGAQKNYRGSQTVCSTSAWHHVCFTWDGTTLTLYGDRTADASVTKVVDNSLTLHNGTAPISIGSVYRNAGGSRSAYFNGYIDDVSIWDTCLDATGVSNLASSSKPANLLRHANVSNLKGWWRWDGNDDATISNGVKDRSGNAGHVTMTNCESGDIQTSIP